MKNTTIFALLLTVIAGCALFAVRDNSCKATVHVSFGPEFAGLDYKWAYLIDAATNDILDSCMVLNNRFSLSHDILTHELPCRIALPNFKFEEPLTLTPGKTIAMNIRPDMTLEELNRMTIENAIARLDSLGLTIPDSLWNQRTDSIEEPPEAIRPDIR